MSTAKYILMENCVDSTFTIQEMAIAIAAEAYNPVILTPDFLKYSGIVPVEWELARPPMLTQAAAQVVFQTGISILAQSNRLVFSEMIAEKPASDIQVPLLVQRCVTALPKVNYQAIGINFTGFVSFPTPAQAARDYLFNTLLAPGAWQDFGEAPMQASLRLSYTLEQAQLTLDINEVKLQRPQQDEVAAVLFAANFNHSITGDTPTARVTDLNSAIARWQTHLQTYQKLIHSKFLASPARASVPQATSQAASRAPAA